MFSLEDKFNFLKWSLIIFSTVIFILVACCSCLKRKIALIMRGAAVVAILAVVALADMYWIEPNWIKTEEVEIHDPALAEVLEGIKVVQISDIHMRGGGGYRERTLVKKVNALRPDLLFITGDFFSENYKKELMVEAVALTNLIRGFRATSGIFGIRGNYDGPLRRPAIRDAFKAAGIEILTNESRPVRLANGKTLNLLGAGSSYSGIIDKKLFNALPANAPSILLAHDPEVFGGAMVAGVNLLLVGHTHGGQIGIPFLVRKSNSANKSPFMGGLYDAGKTKMYVNRGIGTAHLPVRFFCRPELTIIRVVR